MLRTFWSRLKQSWRALRLIWRPGIDVGWMLTAQAKGILPSEDAKLRALIEARDLIWSPAFGVACAAVLYAERLVPAQGPPSWSFIQDSAHQYYTHGADNVRRMEALLQTIEMAERVGIPLPVSKCALLVELAHRSQKEIWARG